MTGKGRKTPSGEPFVMLTRELLASDAWRSLNINARRLIDFLMLEHMRHAGRHNGFLLAPRRELVSFGIGRHFISGAIEEVDRVGLVDCKRGIGRRPSSYSLTWLSLSDGSAPSNRWRAYVLASAEQHPLGMGAVSTKNGCQTAPTKPIASAEQHPLGPKSMGAKQHPPYRTLTTAKPNDGEGGADVLPLPRRVGMPTRRTDEYARPEALDDLPVRFVDGDA